MVQHAVCESWEMPTTPRPTVLLLGIFLNKISSDVLKDMHKNIHSSFIHESHKLGDMQRAINRSNNSKILMTKYHTVVKTT